MKIALTHFVALIVAALMTIQANALSPRTAFVKAPSKVVSTIDSITRLDMLDYYYSGASVSSRNVFSGEIIVKHLSDEAITFSTSASSEVTIAVLPSVRDSVIMAITALALPAPDCKADMYSSDWKPLPSKSALPNHNTLKLWLQPGTPKAMIAEIENRIPFVPAIYTFSNGVLTMTNTLKKLIPDEDYRAVKPYIKPALTFKWDGKKWSETK